MTTNALIARYRYPYAGNPSDFLRHRKFNGQALTVASHSSHDRSLRRLVPADSDYALVMAPLRGSPGNWASDPLGEPSVVPWHGRKVLNEDGPALESDMELPGKSARPGRSGSTRSISVTREEWQTHIHPAIQAIADARGSKITSYGVDFLPRKPSDFG